MLKWSSRIARHRRASVALAAVLAALAVTTCTALASSAGTTATLMIAGVGRLLTIACPSSAQCTALEVNLTRGPGTEITFDPGHPDHPTTHVLPVPAEDVTGFSCPSTTVCAAVTASAAFAFNPQAPSAFASIPVPGAVGGNPAAVSGYGLLSLSCPTTTQCSALDYDGDVFAFSPLSGAPAVSSPLAPPFSMSALSCATATQCTAVGVEGEVTFNPQAPAVQSPTSLGLGLAPQMFSVSCPTTSQCVYNTGQGVTGFDPLTPSDTQSLGTEPVTAVSCASATACIGLDGARLVLMDPTSAGSERTLAVAPNTLNAVACQSVATCTAVANTGGQATTVSLAGAASTATISFTPYGEFSALDCISAALCVANGSAGIQTWNPEAPGSPRVIGAYPQYEGSIGTLSCPSAHQCTDSAGLGTFDPQSPKATADGHAKADTCPTTTQCSRVIENASVAKVETFNPHRPGKRSSRVLLNHPGLCHFAGDIVLCTTISGPTCPSTSQCTVIRTQIHGQTSALSFAPKGGGHVIGVSLPRLSALIGCPSVRECVGLAQHGTGEVTFDPEHPGSAKARHLPLFGGEAGACASRTLCIAVQQTQTFTDVLAFNPRTGAHAHLQPVGQPNATYDLASCPAPTECVLLGLDGQEVSFKP
jgi:hypothetical protein